MYMRMYANVADTFRVHLCFVLLVIYMSSQGTQAIMFSKSHKKALTAVCCMLPGERAYESCCQCRSRGCCSYLTQGYAAGDTFVP